MALFQIQSRRPEKNFSRSGTDPTDGDHPSRHSWPALQPPFGPGRRPQSSPERDLV